MIEVFDNTDMDLLEIKIIKGISAYGNPKCSVCGKEILMVPSYVAIDLDEDTTY
ncbi:hypothetical protein [Bacillus cereus]|uniref:hypothetical protein n=1 Tax=Bacillus cereus TaxID=1396 RepID=UPI001443CD18|nr:hypothetical protein [Bacillus cereus]NKX12610.1 hypothetical protein [Bacillus cereus]